MSDLEINSDGVLTRYTGKQDHVLIPIGVTSIGKGVFTGCTNLISIVIPEGVTSMGNMHSMVVLA